VNPDVLRCTVWSWLALNCLACTRETAPAAEGRPAFDTIQLQVTTASDTFTITAELAQTDEQHAFGLMERRQLDPDAGMLFVYPALQDSTAEFWMHRTRIPLDIAFWDGAGRILAIQSMEPCELEMSSMCPRYRAGVIHAGALELNKGWFARHNVRVGDFVRVLQPAGPTRSTQ
jgi:uncharacterized membrane protein (UPF0127 family)